VFTTIIVRPIFNLLVAIYALLPGHNFGLAIIIFTIVVRLALWPLLKKQLHQAKIMRKLQPELKEIKKAAKGDRQKEALMMQELYKERGINPFGSIGIVLLQLPILIGLYSGLRRVVLDPHQILTFSYPFLRHLAWMQQLQHNIGQFDHTLFGIVDLTKAASGPHGIYWPAMVLVLGSAVIQYYQSKQLLPTDQNSKGLRQIMREAGSGKQADQGELNAAVGRSTRYLLPGMIFLFTVNLPSALSLYWLVGGLVAFIQQSIALREDTTEMEAIADKTSNKKDVSKIKEAEVVAVVDKPATATTTPTTPSTSSKPPKHQRKKSNKKRRRK
jgi:YidC/Oxa1 family membrane protein insertase